MPKNPVLQKLRRWAGIASILLVATRITAAEPDDTPMFDIPRLDNVVIDGKADDWRDAGFHVDAVAAMDGGVPPANDFDSRFRLAWDDSGLLVLITVHAGSFVENDAKDALWQNDSIELYLVDKRGGSELIQAVIAAGMDAKHPALRYDIVDDRKDEALKKIVPSITAARAKIKGGYVMEVLLPWEAIGVKPAPGVEVGFQFFANHFDTNLNRAVPLVWYPGVGVFADTMRTQRLRLSDKASPPVRVVCRGYYDGMKQTTGILVGTKELAGKQVEMRADGKVIASGTLDESGGRSVAYLEGPIPAGPAGWKGLDFSVDGKAAGSVALPDIGDIRQKALVRMQYLFHPFCFDGPQFPKGDFEDPAEAANILGPCTVQISYYDSAFNPATTADKPGRYYAIVEIHPKNGDVVKRYCTLFHTGEPVDTGDITFLPSAGMPPGFGIDPVVAREQADVVEAFVKQRSGSNYFRWPDRSGNRSAGDFFRSPDSAIVMAWLREIPQGTRTTRRNDPWSINGKWIYELKRRTGNATPLDYRVYMPEGTGHGNKKWPAILHLHGSGGTEMSMDHLANAEPVRYARAHKDFPFIIITPHCPPGRNWDPSSLDDLYDEVMRKYPIDPDRFYVIGESLGGYGTWMYAVEHPERFAAAAPVCGFDDPREVDRLKDLPVWDFHGAKDPSVPVQRSYDLVEALRKVHGRVRFTLYPDGLHTIWDDVYNDDELYSWLLQQVRGKPSQPRATVQGPEPSDERQIEVH